MCLNFIRWRKLKCSFFILCKSVWFYSAAFFVLIEKKNQVILRTEFVEFYIELVVITQIKTLGGHLSNLSSTNTLFTWYVIIRNIYRKGTLRETVVEKLRNIYKFVIKPNRPTLNSQRNSNLREHRFELRNWHVAELFHSGSKFFFSVIGL